MLVLNLEYFHVTIESMVNQGGLYRETKEKSVYCVVD